MADAEDLTILLPRAMARDVRAAVKSGDYASASEVVGEALRLWADRRDARERGAAALREAYLEGKASGEPRPLDADRILREADQRMTDRGRA